MNTSNQSRISVLLTILFLCTTLSCKKKVNKKEEQLTITEYQQPNERTEISTTGDSVLITTPGTVLLTGIDRLRLVPVYKIKSKTDRNIERDQSTTYDDYYYNYSDDEGRFNYFMPGIDLIYGYNLINVGHYDLEKDTLSYFFDTPVLIRTLYFPGLKKDSLDHKPISRDYFMVSVYDEDTNRDSMINKKDLRRFYHIDQFNTRKTLLIPSDYSVVKSTYDYKNDVMCIYARHDANNNGIPEPTEPIAIFWFKLSNPTAVRKIM